MLDMQYIVTSAKVKIKDPERGVNLSIAGEKGRGSVVKETDGDFFIDLSGATCVVSTG